MFTIKRRSGGRTSGKAADSYEKEEGSDAATVTIFNKGAEERLTLAKGSGDVVFVENIAGKTIDVIRAPKA